jgi:pSer/pThr/pTyr-binding forkhead associated (FHA) protein
MVMTCARCGGDIPDDSNADVTCPRCGAPQPDPAWTRPFDAAGVPTLESRSSDQGSLAPGKKYAIVVVNGDDPGRVVPIEKPRVVIGRADCDIVLKDPELSRQHVLIAINGTNARLEDLGSTNGTFVDDRRIQTTELVDRFEFRIGSHELVFVMRDQE